jgi:ribosome biogenesis GTPase
MGLEKLGWNDYFQGRFSQYEEKGLFPARVISQQKNNYVIMGENGTLDSKLSGRFRYNAVMRKDYPVVGDWVTAQMVEGNGQAIIYALLPRKNGFARKLPISGGRKIRNGQIVGGLIEEQIVAANIDTAFIVSGLDSNFNLQRIERYITLSYNSGANPVILLNKADLCTYISSYQKQVQDIAIGIPVYPISVLKGIGMSVFDEFMKPGKTVVFLGSSGVGKSTITNCLLGEEKQRVNVVSSANGKGRHTTTSKELFIHDSGCMIIDTPGLRELQLWGDESALEKSFSDVAAIVGQCKYHDCRHQKEPGCAIRQAIEDNIITQERFESYIKQYEELNKLSKEHRQFEINRNRKMKRNGGHTSY